MASKMAAKTGSGHKFLIIHQFCIIFGFIPMFSGLRNLLKSTLGILLRDSKTVVSHMYDYRITCSYDELLRFKSSAATAACADPVK